MAKDLYQVLGLQRGATAADIKRAYRKLAKELHPDQNKDNPRAVERFKEITAAYDVLGDDDKRKRYDSGEIDADGNARNPFAGGGGGFSGAGAGARGQKANWKFESGGSPEDVFQDFFGNFASGFGGRGGAGSKPKQSSRKGQDANYEIAVDFLDAAKGAEKKLALQGSKTLNVKIPPGIEDGQQIRLSGQGEKGPFGGKAGDALIKVKVRPHKSFKREGDDIALIQEIDLETAVLGGKVMVETISGRVSLNVAAGTSSGKTVRLRGKGIARKGKPAGDQLVTFSIALPDDPDGSLEKAIRKWAKAHGRLAAVKA